MGLFFPFLLQKFWTFLAEVEALNQDGSTYHLPPTPVVQHQVEQEEDCSHSRWQVGVPIPQEAPLCPQVPHDRTGLEGHQACQTRRALQTVPQTKESLQSIRRCFEPQGSQREDRAGFPHRGAKDCRQGVEEPRKVNFSNFNSFHQTPAKQIQSIEKMKIHR